MTERSADQHWPEQLRWGFLIAAVLVLAAFLTAQQQSANVQYGQAPVTADDEAPVEGSAGELSGASVPSVEEMTAMVRAAPVVRLPGSIATWDERQVRAAIGKDDTRILVAPPGLAKDARDRVEEVDAATLRIVGTDVRGGIYQVKHDRAGEWQRQFATADVTGLLLSMITALHDQPQQPDPPPGPRRDPTSAELNPVADSLRRTGRFVAPGATLTDAPASTPAFPGTTPLYVALPRQPADQPLVHFGPKLAALFPGRPVLVLYGDWVEYDGPDATEFTEVATASFYGQFGDRLSRYAYPQDNILGTYLRRVTVIRYAGLFDRPLPYVPFDPLRVALPALPWLFAACALAFLALSAKAVYRPGRRRSGLPGVPARLAGLTALAVEISGLTHGPSDSALTRGITQLGAARAALDDALPAAAVQRLLDSAEAELDSAARLLGRADYRPSAYLGARLA